MPTYIVKARTTDGKTMEDELTARDEAALLKKLEERRIYPVSIKEERELPAWIMFFKRKRRKVKHEDKILFTRQLHSMLNAGISLTASLRALADQAEEENIKAILTKVVRDIEGGLTFTEALERHPSFFSNLYVNLIRAGEEGGVLDEMLDRISYLLEYEAETKARIRSATFYPIIVVTELALAFIVIIKFIFPKFRAIFSSYDAALPLPTIIMLKISDLFGKYWVHTLVFAILSIVILKLALRKPKGKELFDRFLLKVPIFGDLILKTLMSRFTRVLGALLESGMPFVRSLDLVIQTMDNAIINEEVKRMREGVKQGRGLAQPLKESGIFPKPVVKMLEVGEQAGDLSNMLQRISAFYDRELDYRIKNLATVLEPVLLVILGISVLFIALSVFLPMWNLMHVVTGA
jgi:type II secretory pathway component PulF